MFILACQYYYLIDCYLGAKIKMGCLYNSKTQKDHLYIHCFSLSPFSSVLSFFPHLSASQRASRHTFAVARGPGSAGTPRRTTELTGVSSETSECSVFLCDRQMFVRLAVIVCPTQTFPSGQPLESSSPNYLSD